MSKPLKIAATANLVHLFDFDNPPTDHHVHIRLTLDVARQLLALLPRFIEEAHALGLAGVYEPIARPNIYMMSDYLRDLGFRWLPDAGREEDHIGKWYSISFPHPSPTFALTPSDTFYRNTLRLYLVLRNGESKVSIGQRVN